MVCIPFNGKASLRSGKRIGLLPTKKEKEGQTQVWKRATGRNNGFSRLGNL